MGGGGILPGQDQHTHYEEWDLVNIQTQKHRGLDVYYDKHHRRHQ